MCPISIGVRLVNEFVGQRCLFRDRSTRINWSLVRPAQHCLWPDKYFLPADHYVRLNRFASVFVFTAANFFLLHSFHEAFAFGVVGRIIQACSCLESRSVFSDCWR